MPKRTDNSKSTIRTRAALIVIVGALVLVCSASANTVVMVVPHASSLSPNVCVHLTSLGGDVGGVGISIYRVIERGEHLFWMGSTDATGKVCPPSLPNGDYRLFASTAKRSATLTLAVNRSEDKVRALDMDLLDERSADIPGLFKASLEQAPLRVWVKEFGGVLQDSTEAVIPRAKIRVWRKEPLSEKALIETQTDAKGEFSSSLTDGRYVAVVEFPGFRTCTFAFEVGPKGWDGLRLTMTVAGTTQLDSDFAELIREK